MSYLFLTWCILSISAYHWFIYPPVWVIQVWRYQRCNQKPYIVEGQRVQWPKDTGQRTIYNIKQKTKDCATRSPPTLGVNSDALGRVSSSCSTCGIRRVTLVTNPMNGCAWGKTGLLLRQVEHIARHLWQIFIFIRF
jgi:hypothetical protein